MEKIIIQTNGFASEVIIGESWETVRNHIPETNVAIVTDTNVKRIYGDKFPDFPVLTVKPGEISKKLEEVEELAVRLLDLGIDRTGFILGIGGGVVCDIAGFLASIYMRGIRCGYVSTSLLSQVDASTGGKNGVNLGSTKNLLGCFKQPEFVICDPAMLKTLPEEEYYSGLAELIKTAIIGDEELFEVIETSYDAIASRNSELLTNMIQLAVKFKASVVSEDERETGQRRILNFGHTYGHAIELYKSFRHGYAVASGMDLAAKYSYSRGFIQRSDCERIHSILKKFNLLRRYSIPDDQIGLLIRHDKKKAGDDMYFVFISGIGRAMVEKITVSQVVDFYTSNKPC